MLTKHMDRVRKLHLIDHCQIADQRSTTSKLVRVTYMYTYRFVIMTYDGKNTFHITVPFLLIHVCGNPPVTGGLS